MLNTLTVMPWMLENHPSLLTCLLETFCLPAGEINEEEMNKVNPYVISVSVFAIVFAGVAGSAYAIYKEVCSPSVSAAVQDSSHQGLLGFWVLFRIQP